MANKRIYFQFQKNQNRQNGAPKKPAPFFTQKPPKELNKSKKKTQDQ